MEQDGALRVGPISARSTRREYKVLCGESKQPVLPLAGLCPELLPHRAQWGFSKHTSGVSKMPGKGIPANKCLKPDN